MWTGQWAFTGGTSSWFSELDTVRASQSQSSGFPTEGYKAIRLAYSSEDLQALAGLRIYSTLGLSVSWTLFRGLSVQELCAARFYKLDVLAPVMTYTFLGVGFSAGQDVSP